jgi:hypothetical protein
MNCSGIADLPPQFQAFLQNRDGLITAALAKRDFAEQMVRRRFAPCKPGGLYQLHNDGMIWRFTGTPCSGNSCPGWQMLDDNFRTTQIGSGSGQLDQLHGGLLYELHNDGSIWRYTGIPCGGPSCIGWQELDMNHATAAITAAGGFIISHQSTANANITLPAAMATYCLPSLR